MARCVREPVLGRWRAAKKLRPEIAEEVATDEEHDYPSKVPECFVDAEKTEIDQKDRHFITN